MTERQEETKTFRMTERQEETKTFRLTERQEKTDIQTNRKTGR